VALRGISITKTFLWFRGCGLFKEVGLLKDRRGEARADFGLSLSARGRATYEEEAKKLRSEDVERAEVMLKTAIASVREGPALAGSRLGLEQRVEALPEAQALRRAVEEFRKFALRKIIANASSGPRPKLAEIEFVGWSDGDDEDEYDPLQAPRELYVVVELPRHAGTGKPRPGKERVRGYAPEASTHALAEKFADRFQKGLPPGTDRKRAVELVVELLEHPDRHPSLGGPAGEFLEELRMLYYSEPIRLVPPEREPMLREAAAVFFEGLSFAKIAKRLNEKGYKSDQGKPFSAALAEHVVIQALLMLGAWGITETEVDTAG